MSETETLPELTVRRLQHLGLTYRAAAERSGGLVSAANINQIALGQHQGDVGERVVSGLALALGVSEQTIRRSAWGTGGSPFELPFRARRLDAKSRTAVLGVIDAILAQMPE